MLEDNNNNNDGQHNTERTAQSEKNKPYPYRSYEKIESRSEYFEETLVVIPAEVRIPENTYDMIDEFILRYFNPAEEKVSIEVVIDYVFRQWAQKVTTDYKKFGKFMLNNVRQSCGLREVDIKKED